MKEGTVQAKDMNWNGPVYTVLGKLASQMSMVMPSARFCGRVRKWPSGENDVNDGQRKHWSNETSE